MVIRLLNMVEKFSSDLYFPFMVQSPTFLHLFILAKLTINVCILILFFCS
jgi:hypothetical protein